MMHRKELRRDRFVFEGGNTGILLLHGYTGSPAEVRPMGEYLAQRGMRVVGPLLPGHGTTAEDLNTRTWREVAGAVTEEFYSLQQQCDRVFVGGLSMGGLLALHLAQHCEKIAGVIPMAAAVYAKNPLRFLLPLLRLVAGTMPKKHAPDQSVHDPKCNQYFWTYDEEALHFAAQVLQLMHSVRDALPKIHQPLLVFQGVHDKTVPMKAAYKIIKEARSKKKTLVTLRNSGHLLCVDSEREAVFEATWDWIHSL